MQHGLSYEVHMYIMPVEGRPIPEFYFEPTGLYLEPGDTVTFVADTPHHTATAYHAQHVKTQRVPEGVEPFSSPVIPVGQSWEYTFDTPGVYDLWCGPHEQYGMAMACLTACQEILRKIPDSGSPIWTAHWYFFQLVVVCCTLLQFVVICCKLL